MIDSSHITNLQASHFVRFSRADPANAVAYKDRMARRGIPKQTTRWFLREWMESMPAYRGRGGQAAMSKATGWSKATMNQLFHGDQDYSPAILEAAAVALNAEPFELLMPPERAHAIRGFRATAATVIATSPKPEMVESNLGSNRRTG